MSMDLTPLFEPLQVRGKTFRNRVVMPPMVVNRGTSTPEAAAWYGRHARGGVGLVIVEATSVQAFGWELTGDKLKPLVNAIHEGGALAAIQLFPTPMRMPMPPDRLSIEEIADIVTAYRTAATVCAAAGFDGIEPHGAHGYLLNQFFSPQLSRRMDAYGGNVENRMRFALEIAAAVRPICADGMLLLYRHTPVGPGYGLAESVLLGKALVQAGVDILDISPSSIDAPGDRAAPFKETGAPVIAVNNLENVGRALEALNEGRADLVAVGRQLIADPDWPIKVRDGRFDEIVPCKRCDGCHAKLGRGEVVDCVQRDKAS
jgi:2,4-dienoyl-CoA reductase-like NADH-dependent reductase (Old Yellow Enzyme family)